MAGSGARRACNAALPPAWARVDSHPCVAACASHLAAAAAALAARAASLLAPRGTPPAGTWGAGLASPAPLGAHFARPCAAAPQDFGLLVDIDDFMQQTDGAPDSLDYNRFKELLAR